MATKYVVAARIDENGNVTGGTAGDQTGNEVCVHTLASSGSWTSILRPPKNAETIIKQAYAAAANDKIGYDQNERTTLYTQAVKVAYELSKITTACECDCSSLVAVLALAAGFSVNKDMYTGNEVSALTGVGFTKIAYSESALVAGDILWRSGHTAVYVGTSNTYTASGSTSSSGSSSLSTTLQSAKSKDTSLAGSYTTTTALNLRYGPDSSKYASMVTMPKGTTVTCYGYYTANGSTKWLYVVATVGGKQYTGFCSSAYLTKSSSSSTSSTATSSTFAVGDKVTVNGTIYGNGNGSGGSIKKTNATMYVVGLVDSSKYQYYIGVATTKGGTRQGWASPSILTKA